MILFVWLLNGPSTQEVIRANTQCGCSLTSYPGRNNEANLMPPLQSAHRRYDSTETAVMKVLSDILDVTDARKVTLLGMLDLSAAFDTVHHTILLQRLQTSNVQALGWIRSFFTDRTQTVAFRGTSTPPCGMVFGKGRFLVASCSCCTVRTSAPSSRNMVCPCTCMPTTLGCTPAVPPSTHPHPLPDWCNALKTLIAGCRRTALS
jgi:Reverse transcriptase (RNA-dependent DNA polymerase)